MIQITEHIQANKDVLNFNGVEETQVIVFTWDASKYKDMRSSADKMGSWFNYKIVYDIIDDGKVGRAIYYITVPHYDLDEDPKKAYISFYFMSDVNNFKEVAKINITQTSTAKNGNFVTVSKDAIVVPFTEYFETLTFRNYGAYHLKDAIFPDQSGVYGQIYDNEIQIITVWNAFTLPTQMISHQRITLVIEKADGTTENKYIDVIFVLPHMCPIWQDLDTTYITTDSSIDYQIYDMTIGDMHANNAIYAGRAYKLPDDDRIRINLNKIVENYVSSNINMDFEAVTDFGYYGKPFRVKTGGKTLGDYIFYNDWSYDANKKRIFFLPQNISDPINYDIVRGQTFTDCLWIPNQNPNLSPWTVLNESPDNSTGSYTPVKGYDNVYVSAYDCFSVVFNTKKLKPDTNYILCGIKTYKVIDCPDVKWVIHYLDKRGGYSSYPVYGNVNVSSKTTPHSMNKTFNNTTSNFETKNYLYESYEIYDVTLPLLKKNEAMRIDEILQSTEIWLERLSDNKMIPVIADVTDFEYKNNKKVRNYTIPFKASQSRLRK